MFLYKALKHRDEEDIQVQTWLLIVTSQDVGRHAY